MIRVVLHDGMYCLCVFCDHCGEQIEQAKVGNYEWLADGDGELFFTHKSCSLAFEETYGGRAAWLACELSALPFYLMKNLALSWDESRRAACWLASL